MTPTDLVITLLQACGLIVLACGLGWISDVWSDHRGRRLYDRRRK